jgi:hypothetical protein
VFPREKNKTKRKTIAIMDVDLTRVAPAPQTMSVSPATAGTAYDDFALPAVFTTRQPRTSILFDNIVRTDAAGAAQDIQRANLLVARALQTNFVEVNWATPLSRDTQRLVFGLWFQLVRVIGAQLVVVATLGLQTDIAQTVDDKLARERESMSKQTLAERPAGTVLTPAQHDEIYDAVDIRYLARFLAEENRRRIDDPVLMAAKFIHLRLLPEITLIEQGAEAWLDRLATSATTISLLRAQFIATKFSGYMLQDTGREAELAACKQENIELHRQLMTWQELQMEGGVVSAKTAAQWKFHYEQLEALYKTCSESEKKLKNDMEGVADQLTDLRIAKGRITGLENRIEELSRQRQEQDTELRAAKELWLLSLEEVKKAQKARADLEALLNPANAMIATLRAQVDLYTSPSERQSLESAHQRLIETNERRHQDGMVALIEKYQKELDDRNAQHKRELDDRNEQHKRELDAKDEQMRKESSVAAEKLAACRREVTACSQELGTVNGEKALLKERVSELTAANTQLRLAETTLTANVASLSAANTTLSADKDTLTAQIRPLNDQIRTLNDQIKSLTDGRFALQRAADDTNVRFNSLSASSGAFFVNAVDHVSVLRSLERQIYWSSGISVILSSLAAHVQTAVDYEFIVAGLLQKLNTLLGQSRVLILGFNHYVTEVLAQTLPPDLVGTGNDILTNIQKYQLAIDENVQCLSVRQQSFATVIAQISLQKQTADSDLASANLLMDAAERKYIEMVTEMRTWFGASGVNLLERPQITEVLLPEEDDQRKRRRTVEAAFSTAAPAICAPAQQSLTEAAQQQLRALPLVQSTQYSSLESGPVTGTPMINVSIQSTTTL